MNRDNSYRSDPIVKQALLIRTHKFGPDERRTINMARDVFGDDIILCFDATHTPPPAEFKGKTVVLDSATLDDLGLAYPDDWAWRCGDFCYYAAVAAFPGYDRYWLIEPDVVFNRVDPALFFGVAAMSDADFLVIEERRAQKGWPHGQMLNGFFAQPRQCFFPLTGLSARALAYLLAQRQKFGQDWMARGGGNVPYANDEAFVASALGAHPDLTVQKFGDIAPTFFPADPLLFSSSRQVLEDDLPNLAPGIVHPVVDKATFEARLSGQSARPSKWFRYDAGYLEGVLSRHYTPERAADILAKVRWKPGS